MADEPRVGSSRPRIMRMVVVLPAPLRPMKAKTLPRGTRKDRPSTAHFGPKNRVTPSASITGSRSSTAEVNESAAIMSGSCSGGAPVEGGELFLDGRANFVRGEVEEDRLVDERVQGVAQAPQPF